jgi:riboflavin synthase
MFTGIVEEIGVVKHVLKKKDLAIFQISVRKIVSQTKLGDSISVDGVCLTVRKKDKNVLIFDAVVETCQRTTLGAMVKGQKVNLEPALKVGDRLGGHFVTGHVDAIGEIKSIFTTNHDVQYEISMPKELRKFIAFKGSICLNGVSLTVGAVKKDSFVVHLIPFTLKETNLGSLKRKDKINIEIDILARYILNKEHYGT